MQCEEERQKNDSDTREHSQNNESISVGPSDIIDHPNTCGSDERCECEDEHADTKRNSDVSTEQLEDDNDAGVIGSNAESKQHRADDLREDKHDNNKKVIFQSRDLSSE